MSTPPAIWTRASLAMAPLAAAPLALTLCVALLALVGATPAGTGAGPDSPSRPVRMGRGSPRDTEHAGLGLRGVASSGLSSDLTWVATKDTTTTEEPARRRRPSRSPWTTEHGGPAGDLILQSQELLPRLPESDHLRSRFRQPDHGRAPPTA
jgi:hypothetical protein